MLMDGNDKYNKSQIEEFASCFHQTDPNLIRTVGTQWAKLVGYADQGGTSESDEWRQDCNRTPREEYWMENNCTVQQYGDMAIWEPCNYASNMAYYHSVLEICSKPHNWSFPLTSKNAIGETFALLGFSSAFYHATQTVNGNTVDNRVVDMIWFVIYQARNSQNARACRDGCQIQLVGFLVVPEARYRTTMSAVLTGLQAD